MHHAVYRVALLARSICLITFCSSNSYSFLIAPGSAKWLKTVHWSSPSKTANKSCVETVGLPGSFGHGHLRTDPRCVLPKLWESSRRLERPECPYLCFYLSKGNLRKKWLRLGGINILFPLSWPTLLKRADPKYSGTKILFQETFCRLQNFFRIENRIILKQVTAIFCETRLN